MPKAGLTLTGDFKELDRFIDKLSSAPDHLRVLSDQLAEEAIELIREGFETSTDPYGDRWAPLKLRAGQPLRDTGGLMAWRKRFSTSQGFVVSSTKDYAVHHQYGTGIYGRRKKPIVPKQARALRFPGPGGMIFARSVDGVPRRRMVPDPGPLPSKWRARFVETSHDVLTELFK